MHMANLQLIFLYHMLNLPSVYPTVANYHDASTCVSLTVVLLLFIFLISYFLIMVCIVIVFMTLANSDIALHLLRSTLSVYLSI